MMDMHGATVANAGLTEGAAGHSSPVTTIATTTAIDVRAGRGLETLLALRNDWTAIIATRPDASFHHSYGWYLSYMRHLERDASSVHFFSFFRDGRPVAIFPLRRVRRRAPMGLSLWLWELPFHPHMNLCDCVIADQQDGAALMRLLVDTLRGRKDLPWDALHLPNLLDDALALGALRTSALSRTLLVRTGQSMYFPCDGTTSARHDSTAKFRRNLRRQRKKLEAWGRVAVSLAQDRTALEQAFAAFLRVEASGWKGGSGRGSAIMLHPDLILFYRDLIEQFAADKHCLISLLKLGDRVIAAQFFVIAGKTLYLLKTAYDESFGKSAPGSQLLSEMLKYCCASKSLARLSLVTGPAWAASRWNPGAHDVWKAYVFNSSLGGLSAYSAVWLRHAVAVLARPSVWLRARDRGEETYHGASMARRDLPRKSARQAGGGWLDALRGYFNS